MGRLCDELTATTPAQIAAMNRAELMTYVSGFISDLEEAGVSGVIIGYYVKTVKSWARLNGTKLDEKVKFPENDGRYPEEMVPTPAEVRSLLDHFALSLSDFGDHDHDNRACLSSSHLTSGASFCSWWRQLMGSVSCPAPRPSPRRGHWPRGLVNRQASARAAILEPFVRSHPTTSVSKEAPEIRVGSKRTGEG
jgi:hypothetical protein